jgi:HlyD family secretion protein
LAIGDNTATSRQLRTLLTLGTTQGLTDGQLLEHFCTLRGDSAELAFGALVDRHGPMVLRTCRAVLGNEPDAHDAFQATFLVLARRAHRLWIEDSLAPWLHEVAHRTATCARSAGARRRRLETRAAEADARPSQDPAHDAHLADQSRVLHAELARLPERDRVPLVLCDLEGQTHEQAARHLGWPVGTVKSRLSRARDRLRHRLIRRGLAPLVPLAVDLPLVPSSLLKSTVALATRFAASRTLPLGLASTLTWEVLRAMTILRSLKAAALLTVMTATATGVVHLALAGPPGGGQGQDEGPKTEPAIARVTDDHEVAAARTGKIRDTLEARGSVESAGSDTVTNSIPGESKILSIVPDRTRVKKGDVVAKLENQGLNERLPAQTRAVKAAESAFRIGTLEREIAEAAVLEYKDGTFRAERDSLMGEIALAKTELLIAEDDIQSNRLKSLQEATTKALAARPNPSPTDLLAKLELDDRAANARPKLERSKFRFETAMTKLDVLQKLSQKSVTRKLELEVTKAKIAEEANESVLSAEQEKSRAILKQIEELTTLIAPAGGIVEHINDPNHFEGDPTIAAGASVRERQPLFNVIVMDGPRRLNLKVGEPRIHLVAPGQRVQVRVDAFPNHSLVGVVERVAPRPDPLMGPINRKVYTTLIRLEDTPSQLRDGMTAGAEIILNEADNALTVPGTAILFRNGKYQVAVKTPAGTFDWREVTTGPSDGTQVEIKTGLKVGELVAVQPISLLSEAEKKEADAKSTSRPSPSQPSPSLKKE